MLALIGRYLSGLRLIGRGGARSPFRPDFERIGALDGKSIVRRFRERSTPCLFADGATLWALAQRMALDRPAWRDRTLEAVERDRAFGLPIYSQPGPRLEPGFPWGNVARGPGGDVLYSVRPHRFAFAPRWALALLYGAPLAAEFRGVLEDWARFAGSTRNEMAYLSNLVVIQRVVALSCAWALLASRPATMVEDEGLLELRILQILCADLRFLAPRLGSSYPNNHLLLDRFAKWFCARVWPEFMPTDSLRDDEDLWLAEWRRQTFDDGAGFEHSAHYHEFACEMAVLYLHLCRANRWPPAPAAVERVRAMLRFQIELGGPESTPIPFGNAVEDPLLPLDAAGGWGTAALREIYRAWFDSGVAPAREDDPAIERAFWLLGGKLAGHAGDSRPHATPAVYRDGGVVILPDSDSASRLTLRTGPAPGTALCGGHAHADLLSIYLSVASTPVIVDAGTHTYRGRGAPWTKETPDWRRYFAGPRAHNGLALGTSDPLGDLRGDFRPRAFGARVLMSRAHVDGGLRWVQGEIESAGPYTGWRRGVIHVHDEYWLVYDILPGELQSGEASFALQFSPAALVRASSATRISAQVGAVSLEMAASAGLEAMRLLKGETDPPGGWVSPAYGELQAAPQLRFACGMVSRLTAFVLQPGSGDCAVETATFDGGYGLHVDHGGYTDRFLLSHDASAPPWRAWDMTFSGALAWVRQARAGHGEFAWIEGRQLDAAGMQLRAAEWPPRR